MLSLYLLNTAPKVWERTYNESLLFPPCSSFANPALWTVRVGLTNQPVSGAADLSVMKIFLHSAYHPEGLSYDIALIRLTQPLTFNGERLLLVSDPN